MAMKVLLINPRGFNDTAGQGVNVGLGYLAGAIQKAGHDVRVLDLNTSLKTPDSQRIESCVQWGADAVGISITSFTVEASIKTGEYFKAKLPKATFWAGGPHITITRGAFLKQHSRLFDGLVVGEGDITIVELLDSLRTTGFDNLSAIQGLVIKTRTGDVDETPARKAVKDLDTLPFPDYEVFDSFPEVFTWYNLVTSRGCPFDCVFCASKEIWGRKWRYRSMENIERELVEVKNKYAVRAVHIVDDNFCLKKGRAMDILNLLSKHGFEISLTGGIRADSVDEELARIIKKNNVSPVVVGVENADPDTFDYVQKGESLEEIERGLKILSANGIYTIATMVIGLINTTPESTVRSINFLRRLGVRGHWQIAIPFPGSALYKWACDNGRLFYDYSRFASEGMSQSSITFPPPVCFDTAQYKAAERLEDYQMANFMTGNYNFLYNESEPIRRVIARFLRLIVKYDIKRIWIHSIGLAKTCLILLFLKWKKKRQFRQ